MARRLVFASMIALAAVTLAPAAAFACGGLVAPGHAETLQRATTVAAWHDGFEHYVTGFGFAGSADHFGYIVPLPGAPSSIQKGGEWTLERLERAVSPPERAQPVFASAALPSAVQVLQQVKIDALNIAVVRGGGPAVAAWAVRNGFDLTPDTPSVLGRYASQGAVFALARFDRTAAARGGPIQGQGETIQFTIPMKAPWIPLTILALGKQGAELVDADLFVLTDHRPSFTPGLGDIAGMQVLADQAADPGLLSDLRSDRGMSWLPAQGMWLTAMKLHTLAAAIHADLSIDRGGPPRAILTDPGVAATPGWVWWMVGLLAVAGLWMARALWRPVHPAPRLA
jgi:hypothetical protein